MIAYLKGVIAEKLPNGVVLDVGGVGYLVFLSNSSLDKIPPTRREVGIHTHLHVREDIMQLYGFTTKAEKQLFELLIGVNGIGPKVGLAILSTYDVDSLKRAIVAEDAEAITAIPGIGKKSAQRLILELKERLSAEGVYPAVKTPSDGDVYAQANDALAALGYSAGEARMALDGYDGKPAVEPLIKFALQKLALK